MKSESNRIGKSRCKGCGAEIEFLKNEATGNIVPVQPVRTTYVLVTDMLGGRTIRKFTTPGSETFAMVSHFEVCPYANRFSKSRRGQRRPT